MTIVLCAVLYLCWFRFVQFCFGDTITMRLIFPPENKKSGYQLPRISRWFITALCIYLPFSINVDSTPKFGVPLYTLVQPVIIYLEIRLWEIHCCCLERVFNLEFCHLKTMKHPNRKMKDARIDSIVKRIWFGIMVWQSRNLRTIFEEFFLVLNAWTTPRTCI